MVQTPLLVVGIYVEFLEEFGCDAVISTFGKMATPHKISSANMYAYVHVGGALG